MKTKRFASFDSSGIMIPILIGLAAYTAIIRFKGFWPADVDWLLPQWKGNIDSAGDYIGWEMYRQSDIFQWPIGKSPMLGPDGGTSIAFTTLPILALIFKPITHWSKTPLQFFGLWSLICFLGQAISAWKLLGLWIKNRIHLAIGVVFFVISPAFLDRLTFHFGPSAHWILLTALFLYLIPEFKLRNWLILGSLSVLVFPYIAAMVTAMYFSRIFRDMIQDKAVKTNVTNCMIYISVLGVVAWQSGYFMVGGGKIGADGFGTYSANALSLVDPGFPEMERMPWSHFVPDRWQDVGQYEGFAFVGSGILVLAMVAWLMKVLKGTNLSRFLLVTPVVLIPVLFGHDPDPAQMKLTVLLGIIVAIGIENLAKTSRINLATKTIVSATVIGMFAFALSNRMLIGQYQLMSIKLTTFQLEVLSTFRSSGRFVWPLMLLIISLVIVTFVNEVPRKFVAPIMLIVLLFQIVDGRNGSQFTTAAFSRKSPEVYLISGSWNLIGEKYDRVLFSPAANKPSLFLSNNEDFIAESGVLWRDIGVLAQRFGWSMNSYHFARDPGIRFQSDNHNLELALGDGKFKNRMLYIFVASDEWEQAKRIAGPNDLVGILDGVPILAPNFYPCSECSMEGFIDRRASAGIDS
jgi:hypothetical protein